MTRDRSMSVVLMADANQKRARARTRKPVFAITNFSLYFAVVVIMVVSSGYNRHRSKIHAFSIINLHRGTVKHRFTSANTRARKHAFVRIRTLPQRRHSVQNLYHTVSTTIAEHESDSPLVESSNNLISSDNTSILTDLKNSQTSNNTLSMVLESVTTNHNKPQLLSHTFAGMVERQLMEQFSMEEMEHHHPTHNHSPIERILQSWRLLEQDYIHKEYIGHHDPDPTSSTSSSDNDIAAINTSDMSYQLCHSYVPGLTICEFWDVSEYDWCQQLASQYEVIRKEFLSVISDVDHLQKHGNNVWATALDTNVAKQYGSGWSTLVLMNRGIWDPQNVQLFPKTSQIIYNCHIPAVEIFFASMQPNSTIPYHSDYTNFVLTSHLGIDIPNNGMNQCRLNVGGTKEEQWLNGKVMIFDTSIMHNAINECTDQVRYILMMRVWHPDLTNLERKALQYIYDTLEFPELITATSIEQRTLVQQQIQQAKAFPLLPSQAMAASLGTTKTHIPTTVGFGTASIKLTKKKSNKKKGGR